jgi:hypothetical protein
VCPPSWGFPRAKISSRRLRAAAAAQPRRSSREAHAHPPLAHSRPASSSTASWMPFIHRKAETLRGTPYNAPSHERKDIATTPSGTAGDGPADLRHAMRDAAAATRPGCHPGGSQRRVYASDCHRPRRRAGSAHDQPSDAASRARMLRASTRRRSSAPRALQASRHASRHASAGEPGAPHDGNVTRGMSHSCHSRPPRVTRELRSAGTLPGAAARAVLPLSHACKQA